MSVNGSEAGRTFNRDRFAGTEKAFKRAVLVWLAAAAVSISACETPTYGPDKRPLQIQPGQSGEIRPGDEIKIVGSPRENVDFTEGQAIVLHLAYLGLAIGVVAIGAYELNKRIRRK